MKMKPQETEALEIVESLLDIADMKNSGPLYADDLPRSGICHIPEDDAAILRQYIAARRAAPEKPLTVEEVKQLKPGTSVSVVKDGEINSIGNVVEIGSDFWGYGDVADGTVRVYAHKPEEDAANG